MCDDFDDFFDLEIEDFALIGGAIGYIEKELEEDIHDPFDYDPYP